MIKRPQVQLYTVREHLARDLVGTLQRLYDIGFREVEPFQFASFAEELPAALRHVGLKAPTSLDLLLDGNIEESLDLAERMGSTTVIVPGGTAGRWSSAESVERLAAEFNVMAEIAGRRGMKVGYHNHTEELKNIIEGQTALEYFAGLVSDDVVLEIDTYWVAAAGIEPAAFVELLAHKVHSLHIKDGPATMDEFDQVAVGKGELPIRDIVRAAPPEAALVIELDETRGDVLEAVADSYAFMMQEPTTSANHD